MLIRSFAAVAAALFTTFAQAAGPTAYSVLEIPSIDKNRACKGQPTALSPTTGLALGSSCVRDTVASVPGIWSRTSTRRLSLPQGTAFFALAVNDSGQAVGYRQGESFVGNAVLWATDGSLRDLPPSVAGRYTYAFGISARGVVGGTELDYGTGRSFPVTWTRRQPTPLPLPSDFVYGGVNAVSRGGLMTGVGETERPLVGEPDFSAVLWQPDGTVAKVGPLYGFGLGVNDAGQVVGGVIDPLGSRGFVATTTGTTILPMREAIAINNNGVIVGVTGDQGSRWIDGVHELLDDLLDAPAKAAQWKIYRPSSIDLAGRIVTQAARADGSLTSVLLIPVNN